MGSVSDSTENLTILIIPGGCSPAAVYHELASTIQSSYGIEVVVEGLPSNSRPVTEPPGSLDDDARAIATKIEDLCSLNRDIVLVPHSYGGLVAQETPKHLLKEERRRQGLPGGVTRIIYLSCIVASAGQSSSDVSGHLNFDWLLPVDSHPEFLYNTDAGAARCFNDMSLTDGVAAIRKMSLQSTRSFTDPTTFEAYKHVPVDYIICEKDSVLPPDFQAERVELLRKARPDGKVSVHKLDTGHCPNVSAVTQCAEVIAAAVNAAA